MNEWMVWLLNSDFVSLESTTVVLSGNKPSIGLIKDKDKTASLLLSES